MVYESPKALATPRVATMENWRPSENLCCSVTGTLCEDPALQKSTRKQNYSAKSLEQPLLSSKLLQCCLVLPTVNHTTVTRQRRLEAFM